MKIKLLNFLPNFMNLPELKNFLLNLKQKNYSQKTIYNYERDLKTFERFLVLINKNINSIILNDIVDYKTYLLSKERLTLNKKIKNKNLSKTSINRLLSALKSYISYLENNNIKLKFFSNQIKQNRTEKKYNQEPTIEEIKQIIDYPLNNEKEKIIGIRNHTIFSLMFNTGMTISEVIKLNINDFNQEKHTLEITQNNKKQRTILLNQEITNELVKYLNLRKDNFEALFIPYRGANALTKKSRISPNYIQMKIKQYRENLGLDILISANTLRKAFVSYILESNNSLIKPIDKIFHHNTNNITQYITDKNINPLFKAD